MKNRSKLGVTIALVFSVISLVIATFSLFSASSSYYLSLGLWVVTLLALSAVIFSLAMLNTKSTNPSLFNIIATITAAIFCIALGLYWILICLIVGLIGCIIYKSIDVK